MANQQQVPSLVIRQFCDSVVDNLGEKSLRLLFVQSGLQHIYSGGELPPADDTPSATVEELSRLFATAFRIFGDRGVRPILLRAGRNSLKHFREHNKALSALAGAAFKVLPTDAKIKLVLSRSAKVAEELLARDGIKRSEVDIVLPPQRSSVFVQRLSRAINLPLERCVDVSTDGLDLYTSSLPYAFQRVSEQGLARQGDIGLVLDVGAGIQVGAAIYRF